MVNCRAQSAKQEDSCRSTSNFLSGERDEYTVRHVIQIVFAIAVFLFEVPTGLYADVKRRKISMILGFMGLCIGELSYSFAIGFWTCALAEVIVALGLAFMSGAAEAYVYDALPAENREAEFRRLWSMRGIWIGIVSIAALPLGGWLGGIDLALPFRVSAGILALSGFACFALQEPPRVGAPSRVNLRTMCEIGKEVLLRDRRLRWLVAVSSMNMLVLAVSFWLYTPLFREAGIPLSRFGVMLAIFNGIFAVSTWRCRKAPPKCGESRALVFGVIAAGVVALSASFLPSAMAIVALMIQQVVRSTSGIWISSATNRVAEKSIRATVISLQSFVNRIVYSGGLGVTAFALDTGGLAVAYATVGGMTLLSSVFLLRRAPAE